MKNIIRIMICAALVFGTLPAVFPVHAASVRVTLPSFEVTLNGIPIENASRRYPLMVYKNITYFPMTHYDCRFLGLESIYDADAGLAITKTGLAGGYYSDYTSPKLNPGSATARTAAFPIRVNGKTIDNAKEQYPLLLYKNITYFPLTWRFAVDEFGWEYSFDSASGLAISGAPLETVEMPSSEEINAIVDEARARLRDGEWLNATFISASRYGNIVTAFLSEHRPSAALWYRTIDLTGTADDNDSSNPRIDTHYLNIDSHSYTSSDGKKWTAASGSADVDSASDKIDVMVAALVRLPRGEYLADESVNVNTDFGYPCLRIVFTDEEPLYLPEVQGDGMSAGGISRHEFLFDLRERCLRTYRLNVMPFFFGDDGKPGPVPAPTTFYDVIDLEYRPFTIPTP